LAGKWNLGDWLYDKSIKYHTTNNKQLRKIIIIAESKRIKSADVGNNIKNKVKQYFIT